MLISQNYGHLRNNTIPYGIGRGAGDSVKRRFVNGSETNTVLASSGKQMLSGVRNGATTRPWLRRAPRPECTPSIQHRSEFIDSQGLG